MNLIIKIGSKITIIERADHLSYSYTENSPIISKDLKIKRRR
jgi:hypothetical protein